MLLRELPGVWTSLLLPLQMAAKTNKVDEDCGSRIFHDHDETLES